MWMGRIFRPGSKRRLVYGGRLGRPNPGTYADRQTNPVAFCAKPLDWIPFVSQDPVALGLPHREPFVFVDEVLALEPCTSANGMKTFRGDEAFFAGHFPGDPIVPGVIITEALAQIAGIAAGEAGVRFLLSAVRVMKFHRAVRPAECIELSATKAGGMGGLLSFEVRAAVAGETVAEGQIILSRS